MSRLITRRSATFGLAAAAAFPNIVRAQNIFDVDVVIVGAGAAGIAAAHELRRLGKRALVLEARARVGGRVYTDRTLGDPWDAARSTSTGPIATRGRSRRPSLASKRLTR